MLLDQNSFGSKSNWSNPYETEKESLFLTISSDQSLINPEFVSNHEPDVVAVFHMSLTNSKYSSHRAVYNLFDFVSDIGGIYGFLLLFGGAINGFIGPTLNAV